MKNNQKKKTTKTIYFTDVPNLECLNDKIDGNFHVFDRKKIIYRQKNIGRNVFNYFNNTHLEQEFIVLLKDKKITNIVYRLYYNNPDKVLLNIKNKVIKKLPNNKDIEVVFKYVVRKENHDPDIMQIDLYDQIIVLDI